MRPLLTILTALLLSSSSFGQNNNLDTWIDRLNNQQVIVMQQYVWYPKMVSPSGDSLLKVGKQVTWKLLPLLTDTSKAVIAHFLLANIWKKELSEAGRQLGSNVYPVSTKNAVLSILYDGFTFYQNDNHWIFARKEDMEASRIFWSNLVASKSSR